MKRQASSLSYLEQVRQHLSRLPSIDPNTRTLLITGFPNVGKSSFINKVTRADVEVQPYAFTTKSLFVGHMDYRYLRWQVRPYSAFFSKVLWLFHAVRPSIDWLIAWSVYIFMWVCIALIDWLIDWFWGNWPQSSSRVALKRPSGRLVCENWLQPAVDTPLSFHWGRSVFRQKHHPWAIIRSFTESDFVNDVFNVLKSFFCVICRSWIHREFWTSPWKNATPSRCRPSRRWHIYAPPSSTLWTFPSSVATPWRSRWNSSPASSPSLPISPWSWSSTRWTLSGRRIWMRLTRYGRLAPVPFWVVVAKVESGVLMNGFLREYRFMDSFFVVWTLNWEDFWGGGGFFVSGWWDFFSVFFFLIFSGFFWFFLQSWGGFVRLCAFDVGFWIWILFCGCRLWLSRCAGKRPWCCLWAPSRGKVWWRCAKRPVICSWPREWRWKSSRRRPTTSWTGYTWRSHTSVMTRWVFGGIFFVKCSILIVFFSSFFNGYNQQERPAFIPENIVKKREAMDIGEVKKSKKRTERVIELEQQEEYFLDLKSTCLFLFPPWDFDWLIDWKMNWLIDWLIDSRMNWSIDWLIGGWIVWWFMPFLCRELWYSGEGTVGCHTGSVEWQKRGRLHWHGHRRGELGFVFLFIVLFLVCFSVTRVLTNFSTCFCAETERVGRRRG